MDPSSFPEAVAQLLAVCVAGRAALSLFPPGWPGRHDPRELGATLAASLVLGVLLLLVQTTVAERLGVELATRYHLAPWLAIGALRWALGPGAMRPRHEPAAVPVGWRTRIVWLLGGLAWAATFASLRASFGASAALSIAATPAAGAALAVGGLERARRAPLARAGAWLALGGLAFLAVASPKWSVTPSSAGGATSGGVPWVGALWVASGIGAGTGGMVAWLRRADRRGLWISIAGFALAAANPLAAATGGAGFVALAACTPRARRAHVLARVALVALLLGALFATCLRDAYGSAGPGRPSPWLAAAPFALLPLTVVWVAFARKRGAADGIEPPRCELAAVGLTLALGALGAALSSAAAGLALHEGLAGLAPGWVLLLGLAFAPAERAERPE